MSKRGFRPVQAVKVSWTVRADRTLGELTVGSFIKLYGLVPFGSTQLHVVALQAWRAPTESDPHWYFQAEGETWRFEIKGRFSYTFEVWWRYEWRERKRRSTAKWVLTLADCLDYGHKHTFSNGEAVAPEPPEVEPEEQQLSLF